MQFNGSSFVAKIFEMSVSDPVIQVPKIIRIIFNGALLRNVFSINSTARINYGKVILVIAEVKPKFLTHIVTA